VAPSPIPTESPTFMPTVPSGAPSQSPTTPAPTLPPSTVPTALPSRPPSRVPTAPCVDLSDAELSRVSDRQLASCADVVGMGKCDVPIAASVCPVACRLACGANLTARPTMAPTAVPTPVGGGCSVDSTDGRELVRPVPVQMWAGWAQPWRSVAGPALVANSGRSLGADVAVVGPVSGADVAGVSRVPVQMCQWPAQSRCRCRMGELSRAVAGRR
jgi:hypothetical protein